MRDDSAVELLEPIADAYASTDADRERVRGKLRERLGSAVFVASTSTAPSWLVDRRVLGAVVGITGIAVIAAVGSMVSNTRSDAHRAVASSEAALEPSTAPTGASEPKHDEPAPPPPEVPTVSVDALPSVKPTSTAPRTSLPPQGAEDDDALVRETRLMASANDAMRGGDARAALALFDQHAREFPRGVLTDERAVSRVLVLCQLGRRDEATADAARFLRTHQASPLTKRIASSCAGDEGAP
jgi:RNA polymerase sigma-70 factor (ECF subfamily)